MLDANAAGPYPSTSNVPISGVTDSIVAVHAMLANISHTFPDDIGVLLGSPPGQKLGLMADVGGTADLSNVTTTFDDQAEASKARCVSGRFGQPPISRSR